MENEFWVSPGQNEPGNEMGHHGSTNLKLQESCPKMPRKTNEVDFGRSNFWPSGNDDCQKMLSFSSYEPNCSSGMSIEFSMCQDQNQSRTEGGLMRGRVKEPFTPSQWMELEHQALIYKHIVSNVPVPSNLLVPFKRSLYSYGSSYPSSYLGWGPFHLGYSSFGNNDPEQGRCRRTDGKKWRCSRDAVPDQKYCERHVNRGRHRSRKPVESQNGHVGSTPTTSKVEPIASSSSPLVDVVHNQFSSLPRNIDNLNTRTQGYQDHPLILSTVDLKSKDVSLSIEKQNIPFEEASSYSMFGLVSSDSLVNPSETITYTNTENNPDSFLGFPVKESTADQHQVHHFIDDWPKDQPNRVTSTSWPEELKSDWTQLSMSIPMTPDFSSSSTSTTQEKTTISTNELVQIHTSHNFGKQIDKQSWVPVSWGNSMGGPLGEVLTSTSSCA